MEYQQSKSEFKVLKLIDGTDILCKVLTEYDDALGDGEPHVYNQTSSK